MVNLRAQVDDIETQNARMLQEEQNYKRLHQELRRVQGLIKVDNGMQAVLLKAEYNDEEQVPALVQALEALKLSLDP